jgi:hypothetical protein
MAAPLTECGQEILKFIIGPGFAAQLSQVLDRFSSLLNP